jgi:hypothetical protein
VRPPLPPPSVPPFGPPCPFPRPSAHRPPAPTPQACLRPSPGWLERALWPLAFLLVAVRSCSLRSTRGSVTLRRRRAGDAPNFVGRSIVACTLGPVCMMNVECTSDQCVMYNDRTTHGSSVSYRYSSVCNTLLLTRRPWAARGRRSRSTPRDDRVHTQLRRSHSAVVAVRLRGRRKSYGAHSYALPATDLIHLESTSQHGDRTTLRPN